MAVINTDYWFIYCNTSGTGCGSDGGVFVGTLLKHALENGTIGFPPHEPLQLGGRPVSHYLLVDAFPTWPWLLKPYPHRSMTRPEPIFSYRLQLQHFIFTTELWECTHWYSCLTLLCSNIVLSCWLYAVVLCFYMVIVICLFSCNSYPLSCTWVSLVALSWMHLVLGFASAVYTDLYQVITHWSGLHCSSQS